MSDKITTDLRFSMVPAWVLDSGISDKAIRLYAVLAGYADSETGQAFPGRSLLAKRMGCSLKTVDRAVTELIGVGAIRKQQRVSEGHYQSSLYTVVRIDPTSRKTRPLVTDDATPRHTRRDPVSPVTHRTITTELEPYEQESLNNMFIEFWNLYPLKRGKGAAAKAFQKAIHKISIEKLLDATRRFRDDPHRPYDFTPLASTWLNQERWDDEPYRKRDADKTNSEKNIEKLRASMELLGIGKEVESNEQNRNRSITDFGINFRSAEDI